MMGVRRGARQVVAQSIVEGSAVRRRDTRQCPMRGVVARREPCAEIRPCLLDIIEPLEVADDGTGPLADPCECVVVRRALDDPLVHNSFGQATYARYDL